MIYIHIPLCRSFCTYCGFYSEILPGQDCTSAGRLADRICAEARARAEEIRDSIDGQGCVDTLYIGGGTPSVLPPGVLSRIVRTVSTCGRDGGPFEEFTLEVNPDDIVRGGPEYVRSVQDLGVTRISMGVQSFDDRILRWMNRRHDAASAVRAVEILRKGGIPAISLDLILGIPHLEDAVWEETLRRAVSLLPEHISAYQLSVEEGSTLAGQIASGRESEAPAAQCSRQYDRLCRVLGTAGYHHYEISNFALPGHEAVHNSAYWRRVPYVGLGPGAHSFRVAEAGNPSAPVEVRSWNAETLGDYAAESEILSAEDAFVEKVMLALRTDKGLSEKYLQEHCRADVLAALRREGCLVPAGNGETLLRIPEERFFVCDDIIRRLVSAENESYL